VFEHFDRDHAVESAFSKVKHVDIAGENFDVAQSALCALAKDVLALAGRVRHPQNPCFRKALGHPQSE
jgi:hypothetical protein